MMTPTLDQIRKAKERATARVQQARVNVNVNMNGRVSEPMQFATYQRIKLNPGLEQSLKDKYGNQWNEYETAMGELSKKFSGGFSDA